MPVRFAIASGNWSNPAIWDNGALPVAGDDVYTNGFTVAIDQNITVASLRNGVSPVVLPNIATSMMTGNQFPGTVGYAFASSEFSASNQAFNAFDHNLNTAWISVSRNNGILGYKFVSAKIIKRYSMSVNSGTNVDRPYSWSFQGSNDGSTWDTLDTITTTLIGASARYISGLLANTTPYTWYRLNVTATESAAYEVRINEFGMTESVSSDFAINTGGTFTLAGSYTINANLISNRGTLLSYTASSPASSTINGYVFIAQQIATVSYGILHTGTGTLTVNGNVYNAASLSGSTTAYGIYCGTNSGVLNINGDVLAYGHGQAPAVIYLLYVASNFTVSVVGNVISYANYVNYTGGVAITLSTPCILNVIGDVYGSNLAGSTSGLAYQNSAIHCTSASTINITGNVYGPSGVSNINLGLYTAITISAAASLTIVGNVIGGGSYGQTIYTTSTPTINITGNVVGAGHPILRADGAGGSISVVGVITAGTVVSILVANVAVSSTMSGPFINSATGVMAVSAPRLLLTGSPTRWYLTNSVGGDRTLYSSDFAPGYPDIQDVRSGVSYNGGTMTGTMVVPPASSVASGVPVDATTGTAFITSAQVGQAVWDYLITNIADPSSIGYRLKDASTVTTTGSQIQALNGL